MKILIACDKFKGTFSSKQIGEIISKTLKIKNIETKVLEVSDGGDGFINSIMLTKNFTNHKCKTVDALGNEITANYLISDDKTAIIESAESIGLKLINPLKLNVMRATSRGFGIVIKNALKHNPEKIITGIGGTATVDGFCGAANELGFKLLDKFDKEIYPVGENLLKIDRIVKPNIDFNNKTKFYVASDVTNPLLGENGAAKVFAPQKGASEKEVEILENGLENLSKVIKKCLFKDVTNLVGGGAGGGIAAGMSAFLDAEILSGSDIVLNNLDFNNLAQQFDLIITGEGSFDNQSLDGKIVGKIVERCKIINKKILIVCGITKNITNFCNENIKIFPLFNTPPTLQTAMNETPKRLEKIVDFFE